MKILAIAFGLFALSTPARAYTLYGSSDIQGWTTDTLSINVNYDNCGVAKADLQGAIDRALALWNRVPTSRIKLVRGNEVSTTPAQAKAGSASDGTPTPLIVCDPDMTARFNTSSDPFDSEYIPALTIPDVDSNLNINYAVMFLNAESGKYARISNLSIDTVTIVIAHELGHVLGLGHTQDKASLMYYNASARTELSLSQDDMDGVTFLYPRAEIGGNKMMGCGSLALMGGGSGGKKPGGSGGPWNSSGGSAAATEFAMLLALMAMATQALKFKWRTS